MKETYSETPLKSIYLISPSHTHLCSSPRSWLDNWVRSDLIRPAVFFVCLFLLSGFGVQKNWCSRYKKYFFTLSKLTIVLSLFSPPTGFRVIDQTAGTCPELVSLPGSCCLLFDTSPYSILPKAVTCGLTSCDLFWLEKLLKLFSTITKFPSVWLWRSQRLTHWHRRLAWWISFFPFCLTHCGGKHCFWIK